MASGHGQVARDSDLVAEAMTNLWKTTTKFGEVSAERWESASPMIFITSYAPENRDVNLQDGTVVKFCH